MARSIVSFIAVVVIALTIVLGFFPTPGNGSALPLNEICQRYNGKCVDYSQCYGHWKVFEWQSQVYGLCPNTSRQVVCCVPAQDATYRYHPAYYPHYNLYHPYYYQHANLQNHPYYAHRYHPYTYPYQTGYPYSGHPARPNSCGCSYDYATRDRGSSAPGAQRLAHYFTQRFGGATLEIHNSKAVMNSSANNNGSSSEHKSLHNEGRAVDLQLAGQRGREAFEHAVAIACQVGIQEVIHNGRIWTHANGEYAYRGVNSHSDYVHIGLNKCGAEHFSY